MRTDLRPYWAKKLYLIFRQWYAEHFLRPACDSLGDHHTIMCPWYVSFFESNISIGKCATIIAEAAARTKLGVRGRDQDSERIVMGDYVMNNPAASSGVSQAFS